MPAALLQAVVVALNADSRLMTQTRPQTPLNEPSGAAFATSPAAKRCWITHAISAAVSIWPLPMFAVVVDFSQADPDAIPARSAASWATGTLSTRPPYPSR